jgi:peptidoglycan/xylan/chitin deacetylase (PgdA/CDA1 family)
VLLRGAVALTYHAVDDLGGAVSFADDPHRLVTSPEHLRAHIRLLRRVGYQFVTASAFVGDRKPGSRVAALTFDDGFAGWVTHALPVLEQERVPATFYVCPGWWEHQHPDVAGHAGRLLAARDVGRLVDAGMAVGSHAWDHPDLRGVDDVELERQVVDSKRAIEDLTGLGCETFAYPFGLYDDRVADAVAAAGYELAWGWVPGRWRRFAAPRLAAPPRHGGNRLLAKLAGIRRFWTT